MVIPIVYYSVLTWAFYNVLSKPVEGGRRSMLERIRRYYGPYTIAGIVLVFIGIILVSIAVYVLVTNNEEVRWSDILAIGLALISFGIALISLGIASDSTRRLEKVTDSDYDNFVDNLENERLKFLAEARIRKVIDHFMVEVVAWKSKQYFEKAINLRELVIDKSKLRFLSIMVKHLAHLLLVQSQKPKQKWIKVVWNRDVHNIVKMYSQLWDTEMIEYAEEHIRRDLINIFDNYIGERKPDEEDTTFFRRIQVEIGKREPNEPFKRIVLEKKQKKK